MKSVFKLGITSLLTIWLFVSFSFVVQAHPPRMVDNADLLSSLEEEHIEEVLDKVSIKWDFDVVVVTADSVDGKSSMAYADDYFDYNGYGIGDNYDGVLLLVNMEDREWYISTSGYGIKALRDSDLDYIGEYVAEELSYGAYAEAFEIFADLVEGELEAAKDAESLEVGEVLLRLLLALGIGAAIAFIPVTIMKKQMDNVELKREASDYVKRDKSVIAQQRDIFLYRNIQRRKKPENNGSSTHRGSSGRSHGGRGGRF